MMKRRIAILEHEKEAERPDRCYLIHALAGYWREDGHEVVCLMGTKHHVPADLLFVHVDRSVVPHSYLEFARQYPIVVNGHIRDIRKSSFIPDLLHPDDAWEGPVIVKSDKNCAGLPERLFDGKLHRKMYGGLRRLGLQSALFPFSSPEDYRVYDSLAQVPRYCFYHPALVVQRFTPEREGALYCVRIMSFLGDRVSCMRLKGRHPIVNGNNYIAVEHGIEPDPDILALRRRLRIDYGKLDYVVVDGRAILLDVNKTTGAAPDLLQDPELRKAHRYRAGGLYDFFKV